MPHNANRVIVSTPESGRHSCRRLLHINTGCIPLMPPFAGSFFHNVRPIRQIWRKRVGVETTVNLQIDRVYAALRTPTSLQSLLNITVLGASGIESSTILRKIPQTAALQPLLRDNHYKHYKNDNHPVDFRIVAK